MWRKEMVKEEITEMSAGNRGVEGDVGEGVST